jgi:cytochrome c oxidase assembly protein subunit 11
MTIRFNADVERNLGWHFAPEAGAMKVRIGEQTLALYSATNLTDRPITGTATYNVTPEKAGVYFSKIDCFCFEEQTLQPGEAAELPVSFFVDPAILDDPELDRVETITLSYMFFEKESAATGGAVGAAAGTIN